MRYFDAFAGVGGFGLGIRAAVPGAECVGSSEIDPFASAVHDRRHPGRNLGDIAKIDWGRVPDFDLLTGGVPCQAWSVAGKRGGFSDPRGTLWAEFARALREKRPRLFIAENVKGLLSHDGGRSFEAVLRMLEQEGYRIRHAVLNAHDFGVPQRRERVFLVGFRVGGDGVMPYDAFSFPDPSNPGTTIGAVLEPQVDAKYYLKPETARKILARLKRPGEVLERLGVPNVLQMHHGAVRDTDHAQTLTAGSDGDRQQFVLGGRDNVSFAIDAKDASSGAQGGRSDANGGKRTIVASAVLRWQNKDAGAVPSDQAPTLRASRGTDIRKQPVVVSMRGRAGENSPEVEEGGACPTIRGSQGGSTHPVVISRNHGSYGGGAHDYAPSLTVSEWQHNHLLALYDAGAVTLRRLTPVECERLQGWPDGWTARGVFSPDPKNPMRLADRAVSDTQRYRMAGNGVCAPVVAAVVRKLAEAASQG